MGAWTGPLCSIYNHSVPVSELLATMQLNFLAAQKQLNSTLPQHPLCFFGQECVGWGIDIFDGRVAQSTLVELTVDPDDPSRRWGGYLAPQEVDFEPFVKPEPNFQDGAGAFPLPSDLVSFVNQRVGVNDGLRGIYSSSWEDIFGLYYNDTKDKALSVVQAGTPNLRLSACLLSACLPVCLSALGLSLLSLSLSLSLFSLSHASPGHTACARNRTGSNRSVQNDAAPRRGAPTPGPTLCGHRPVIAVQLLNSRRTNAVEPLFRAVRHQHGGHQHQRRATGAAFPVGQPPLRTTGQKSPA